MKIIKPDVQFITPIDGATILKRLEQCGRVCYKSEDKITEGSAEKFVAGIIKRGHEAVLEHCSFTVKFICDRGVSHEIVRHRMASYCQESTRYCNYGKGKFGEEITVIEPCFWPEGSDLYWAWKNACLISEQCYFSLLKSGATPQEARSVLPNSLKTEVVMTANIREWRHFLIQGPFFSFVELNGPWIRKSRNRLWKMIGPLTWTKNHPSCGCFTPNLALAQSA